jgi:NADH-quinone oxidoreductase subunit N
VIDLKTLAYRPQQAAPFPSAERIGKIEQIGAAPKLAAFVFVLRILVQGLEALVADWQGMLVIIAVLSMAIGNITAIAQTNVKRLLAYSTISHMGFLLLGLIAGTPEGYSAALFYTVIYVLMSLVGFGILLALSRAGFECEKLEDLRGLNQRNSWYAFLMLLAMFSMAGIPPLVGFYAKLAVIKSVVDIGLIWLAVVAVVMSLIGAFYYLRVVKYMYFDDQQDSAPIVVRGDMKLVLSINAVALLVLGALPERLLVLCVEAMKQSLTAL